MLTRSLPRRPVPDPSCGNSALCASGRRPSVGDAKGRHRSSDIALSSPSRQTTARSIDAWPSMPRVRPETVFVTRDGRIVHSFSSRPSASGAADAESPSGWTVVESFLGGRVNVQPGAVTPTGVSRFTGRNPSGGTRADATYASISLGAVWPGVRVSLDSGSAGVREGFPHRGRRRHRHRGDRAARRLPSRDRGGRVPDRPDGTRPGRPFPPRSPIKRMPLGIGRRSRPPIESEATDTVFVSVPTTPRKRSSSTRCVRTTYLGGSGDDTPTSMAFNPTTRDVIVAGSTVSTDFPGTFGGAQTSNGGMTDAFVALLSGDLTTLRQVTYLGGGQNDYARRVLVPHRHRRSDRDGPDPLHGFPGNFGGSADVQCRKQLLGRPPQGRPDDPQSIDLLRRKRQRCGSHFGRSRLRRHQQRHSHRGRYHVHDASGNDHRRPVLVGRRCRRLRGSIRQHAQDPRKAQRTSAAAAGKPPSG